MFLVISALWGKCLVIQPSRTEKTRRTLTPEEEKPEIYSESPEYPISCPDLLGKEVCCNDSARYLFYANFNKLDFVSDCETCKNNLKRFLFDQQLPHRLQPRPRRLHHQRLR